MKVYDIQTPLHDTAFFFYDKEREISPPYGGCAIGGPTSWKYVPPSILRTWHCSEHVSLYENGVAFHLYPAHYRL